MADQIHAYYHGNAAGPIAVTTFVDVNNLYDSSTFGRLISEQLMSELAMRGYKVIELRQAEAMQIMHGQGEFLLSRELPALRKFQDVSGLVVGTYVASPERVYLNARLVHPRNSSIISVGSVEMARTKEISNLLRSSTLPPSLERIPVRSLGHYAQPLPSYWPYTMPGMMEMEEFFEEDDLSTPEVQMPSMAPRTEGMKEKAEADMKADMPMPVTPPQPTLEPTT